MDMDRRLSVQSQRLDRFIPYRPGLDFNAAHARIMSCSCSSDRTDEVPRQYENKSRKQYERLLSDALNVTEGKILPMTSTPIKKSNTGPFTDRQNVGSPTSPDEGYYSPGRENSRRVPLSPECIMDMPGLRDDFYTNLLDWNSKNLLAVALNQSIYVWNASTKECQRIDIRCKNHDESDHLPEDMYVSALSWSPDKPWLAVADSYGEITISDIEKKLYVGNMFEQMESQDCSVGALQWTQFGLISGNRKGGVTILDMRTCAHGTTGAVQQLRHHGKEVCGLRLCPRTTYLACGADSGRVCIWDLRMSQQMYRTFKAHTACAKALAWCPWRSSMLATGGGSSDGHIRVWHIHTGEMKNEVNTKSQICALLWPDDYGELVSSHGSTTPENNDIILWRMRRSYEFEPQARLRQHTARALHLALSPDETTIELDKYFNDIAVVLGSLTGCSDELKQPNARGISTHENLPIARENAKKSFGGCRRSPMLVEMFSKEKFKNEEDPQLFTA